MSVDTPTPSTRRFSGNDLAYYLSLAMTFAGLAWHYSPAIALIVIGAWSALISTLTSFFVTWLSTQEKS
jgi:hypothetical protein